MVTENKPKLNEAEREKLDERKTFTSEKITKKKRIDFELCRKRTGVKERKRTGVKEQTRTNNNYMSAQLEK